MLDGDSNNKKSNSKLAGGDNLGLAKQQSGGKQRTLNRDRSKDLEESWGSLQLQAEQMLGTAGSGDIEDETTSPFAAQKRAGGSQTNVSVNTASAAAQHKIEEEIIAEEIRLAHQQ